MKMNYTVRSTIIRNYLCKRLERLAQTIHKAVKSGKLNTRYAREQTSEKTVHHGCALLTTTAFSNHTFREAAPAKDYTRATSNDNSILLARSTSATMLM